MIVIHSEGKECAVRQSQPSNQFRAGQFKSGALEWGQRNLGGSCKADLVDLYSAFRLAANH